MIKKSKVLLLSVCALCFSAQATAKTVSPSNLCNGVPYTQILAKFKKLQTALAADDKKTIDGLVSYPVRINAVRHNKHIHWTIKNTQDLNRDYQKIFSKALKKYVIATPADDVTQMICNYQGIGIVNGALWFDGKADSKIYVVNVNPIVIPQSDSTAKLDKPDTNQKISP